MIRHVWLPLLLLLLGGGPMMGSAPVLTGCAKDDCEQKVEDQRNACIQSGGEPVDCYAKRDNGAFSTKCESQCACIGGSLQ